MKKIFSKKGFTLIEMLIAMGIFVVFMGVLLNSYTYVIKAQREANDYRVLYSEARRVFDFITEEVRENAIYYGGIDYSLNSDETLMLISKDLEKYVEVKLDDEDLVFGEADFDATVFRTAFENDAIIDPNVNADDYYSIMSEGEDGSLVKVKEFQVFVNPMKDPYFQENTFFDGIQFHPQVTVYAKFEMEKRGAGEPYSLELRTTISSRLYSSLFN